jgi:hypothetical protein
VSEAVAIGTRDDESRRLTPAIQLVRLRKNYGDVVAGADIDREIFEAYARFYLRRPRKITHLLEMASAGGLWRSLSGTAKAALLALVGRGEAGTVLPSLREPM